MDEMQGWHWRNTMKPARFFRLDARAGALWVLVLMHFRQWTVLLAILVSVIFVMLERRGLTFASALRSLRSWIVGNYRPGVVWTSKREFRDTGSI